MISLPQHPNPDSVKVFAYLLFPVVLLTSCALEKPEEEEAEPPPPTTPAKKKPETDVAPPITPPLKIAKKQGITFIDPDTTGSLLTEERKKTITGPIPTPKPAEGDNLINVAPPPLPSPSLPDEKG